MRSKLFFASLILANLFFVKNVAAEFDSLTVDSKQFDNLEKSFLANSLWKLPNDLNIQRANIERLIGKREEIKELVLEMPRINLKFAPLGSPSTSAEGLPINEYELILGNDPISTDIKFFINVANDQITGRDGAIFKLQHSLPGSAMPQAGYAIETSEKSSYRTLLPSEADTQLALFVPKQKDFISYGFMFCPRKITKTGNSQVGRMLELSQYTLREISIKSEAQILAKVVDGFGPGEISSEVLIEKHPSTEKLIKFEDTNKGHFPESVIVLPPHFAEQSLPYQSGVINDLGVRINLVIKDSSGSRWIVSFKRGIAVREIKLGKNEPMIYGGSTLNVKPGICYQGIYYLKASTKRIAPTEDLSVALPELLESEQGSVADEAAEYEEF